MAKKEGIRKLFDRIAPDYDRLNHLLSLNIDKTWRRRAVKEIVRPSSADTILDVACGTGDFTIEIARKAAPASTIIGIDLSEGMMAIGREKIAEAGLDKLVEVKMTQGDCEALPYPDETFDRISAGFGVRNFEHLEIGLGEMFRTLKKEGKLVILELSVPSNRLMRSLYKLYFLKILPAIGGWISGERGAYEYLPASVLRFPAPERFMEMMSSAGFREIRQRPMTFGICRMYTGLK